MIRAGMPIQLSNKIRELNKNAHLLRLGVSKSLFTNFLICGTVYFSIGSIILTSPDFIKSNEVKIIDPIEKEICPPNLKIRKQTLIHCHFHFFHRFLHLGRRDGISNVRNAHF